MRETLKTLALRFPGKRVVVIGDVMLDRYVHGAVTRVSPEAPIPVVHVSSEDDIRAGGAANVAVSVAALGGKVTLFGSAGDDDAGRALERLLKERGVVSYFAPAESTIEKVRIMGNSQQIARIDREVVCSPAFQYLQIEPLLKAVREADIVIVSDYNKGAVTQDLASFLYPWREKVVVDTKPGHEEWFKEVRLIKPNEKEALVMADTLDVDQAGARLRNALRAPILITRGQRGMSLYEEEVHHIPTAAHAVFDVSGAGDTVIAVLSMALAAGGSTKDAAALANVAAGIAVGERGTYAVSHYDIMSKLGFSTTVPTHELGALGAMLRNQGKRIIWTNGCFDLLHPGHVSYLTQAKELGDVLVVGINSDESVRLLKGPQRPVRTAEDRAAMLAALASVDYVTVYEEATATTCLEMLRPHIFVKGGDYTLETLNSDERRAVEAYKGSVVFLDYISGHSTTGLIELTQESKPMLEESAVLGSAQEVVTVARANRARDIEILKAGVYPKGWGEEVWIINTDKYCGKLLKFKKGSMFSHHFHIDKDEAWYVIEGKLELRHFDLTNANPRTDVINVGDVVHVPPCAPHQLVALEDSVIIEVSTPHAEEDSYRIGKGDSQKG